MFIANNFYNLSFLHIGVGSKILRRSCRGLHIRQKTNFHLDSCELRYQHFDI